MPESTECVVSVGSDIALQWTETRDGSISLSIRLLAGSSGPQKRRKEKFLRHTESWENGDRTVRFQLAAEDLTQPKPGCSVVEAEDEEDGQGSQGSGSKNGQSACDKSKDNQGDNIDGESNQNSEDDQNNESEAGGDEARLTSRPKDINSVPTRASCKTCAKICAKITNGFPKRQDRLRECHSLWMEDPKEFFGMTAFSSSEQWSLRALTDSEKNLDEERSPFHKVNVAYHLQERIKKSKFSETNCRKAMLQQIYPGFDKLDRPETKCHQKRLARHITQGRALTLITTENPGLLFVAGSLSREE